RRGDLHQAGVACAVIVPLPKAQNHAVIARYGGHDEARADEPALGIGGVVCAQQSRSNADRGESATARVGVYRWTAGGNANLPQRIVICVPVAPTELEHFGVVEDVGAGFDFEIVDIPARTGVVAQVDVLRLEVEADLHRLSRVVAQVKGWTAPCPTAVAA